jgi:uncharacterized phage protein (TIGR02218 family)
MGFTDHDKDLVLDGVTYEALTGFNGTELHESIGLNVDNQDLEGSIRSDRITEDDIIAGAYDDCQITVYRVNWANPTDKVLIKVGTVGQITRYTSYFKAELRGLSHYLQQTKGRLYQYSCDVDLGSPRCGVNLAAWRSSGTVASIIDVRVFTVTGALGGFASDIFTRGKLTWTSGANSGKAIEIKSHTVDGSGVISVEIWQETPRTVVVGDTFNIEAGCDKQPVTCRDRFANFINFQGFPYMPGQDYTTDYATRSDANLDGQSHKKVFP